MVPLNKTISPSGESLISLENLSSLGKVTCSQTDETICPLGEGLNSLFLFQHKNIALRGNRDFLHELHHIKYCLKGWQGSSS